MALIVLYVVGCALVAAGAALIYMPAGLIAAGVAVLAAVFIAATEAE
jgi:uncharacterized membrane-anchored protein YitT (DUF2179 family)